jgi:hypothetical protein
LFPVFCEKRTEGKRRRTDEFRTVQEVGEDEVIDDAGQRRKIIPQGRSSEIDLFEILRR